MTELTLALQMEKIDLLAKIEAFNKKASMVGVEPIGGISRDVADTDASRVDGKVFDHLSCAEKYLEKVGWEHVSPHHHEYMKGAYIAKVEPNPTGHGWIIVTM